MLRFQPKYPRRLILFVVVLFLAAGCGSDDDDSLPPTSDTPSVDGEATASSDVTDLSTKPPIDAELLGRVDELIITDVVEGDGDEAVDGLFVSMQYVGVTAEDGAEFDSSWDRGAEPLGFTLGQGAVISGWDQGIVGMRVGGRRILQVPSTLAYGSEAPSSAIGADSDLLFIVDLVAVTPPPPTPTPPPPAPPIPEDALGSFDELGIIDLVEGTGKATALGDIVEVQYVGVTADDGTEFDSTWSRGGLPFRLSAGRANVIEGWNEGLLGMKVGGERILQIPAVMGYNDGDLVFLVHLEGRIDAPYGHTVTFDGPAPEEVEVTTIVEGSGRGAEVGDAVEANITVLVHSRSEIIQSSWTDGAPASLFLQEDPLPGLNQGLVGIKVGEIREIFLPTNVAFPDGFPSELELGIDDGLVFVVEPITIEELAAE